MTASTDAIDANALIRSSRRAIVSAVVFSAGINLLYFAAPLYFVQVFTRVLSSRSIETLTALSAIVGLCILALTVLEGARAVVVRRAGEAVDAAFAPLAVERALDPASRENPLADLERMARIYASPALIALLDLPWIAAFVLALALLHPWLGLLSLAGTVVLAGLAFAGARLRLVRGRALAACERDHAGALRPWLGHEGMAAALGLRGLLSRRWLASRDALLRAQGGSSESQAVVAAAGRALRLGLQCAAIGVGAVLVIQDAIGPAAMFAASLLLARALAPVEAGVAGLMDLRGAGGSTARLACPIGARPAPAWRSASCGTGLSVERLSWRGQGSDDLALAGIGLRLVPGEMLGLIGPTGSGKSLLLACLAGALAPSAGTMRLGRLDCAPGRAGYLPQAPLPLEGTLEEVIGCGRRSGGEVAAAAESLGLDGWIASLPDGLRTRLAERGEALPAGIRQRIAVARAVCGRPPLVLLDEPTAHLDSDGERALLDTIAALKAQGTIVVAASHRPSVLGLADSLLVLDSGRERMRGTRNEVLAALARSAVKAVPKPAAPSTQSA